MSRLRVGVDATSWSNRRGFGRFARNAVGRLVALDPETRYVLYVDDWTASTAALPRGAEQRCVHLAKATPDGARSGSTRGFRDLVRLTRAVRRDRLDVFLFPSLLTYFPIVGVPTVVGVHDTIAEDHPGLTAPSRKERALLRLKHTLAVRRASRVFTVSEASRQTVSARFGIPADRLRVVPEAPDPTFSPRTGKTLAAGLAAAGLSTDERFFLFAGGISPHKNVETLVDAYARLRAERDDDLPLLVLAGDLKGEAYLSSADSVRERIRHHALEHCVHLPGFVSDESLACLYSAATAVVIPSLAEGFGLPAVEAAACGAAVALSDLPPHRETLEGAALFFDPGDSGALAHTLDRLAGEEALRDRLGKQALAAAGRLSWNAAATRLRELIGEAAAPA